LSVTLACTTTRRGPTGLPEGWFCEAGACGGGPPEAQILPITISRGIALVVRDMDTSLESGFYLNPSRITPISTDRALEHAILVSSVSIGKICKNH
jgi:hypothetical protein